MFSGRAEYNFLHIKMSYVANSKNYLNECLRRGVSRAFAARYVELLTCVESLM